MSIIIYLIVISSILFLISYLFRTPKYKSEYPDGFNAETYKKDDCDSIDPRYLDAVNKKLISSYDKKNPPTNDC